MRNRIFLLSLFLMAALVCGPRLRAQSFYQQVRSHNVAMTDLQPSWMGPLMQSDSRLSQGVRFSVSDSSMGGARVINYGNNHGVSLIAGGRFQLDFDPPSFFRNHSAAHPDGFGNAGAQLKYRIVSGDAAHGNFAVTAIDFHGFAPRAEQNGLLTAFDSPKIAAGIARGRFDLQTTLGGFLPVSKAAAQGRAIEWNVTGQLHAGSRLWLDIEENAAFNFGGPFDGRPQNFITPAGFYMLRRQQWDSTHPVFVVASGMQIATSAFHLYNHNFVSELRILF